jgi:hypothetical protein
MYLWIFPRHVPHRGRGVRPALPGGRAHNPLGARPNKFNLIHTRQGQQVEALERLAAGECCRAIARTFGVTTPPSPSPGWQGRPRTCVRALI